MISKATAYKWAKLYKKGLSLQAVACKDGTNLHMVRYHLKKLGVKSHPKGRPRGFVYDPEKLRFVKSLRAKGRTFQAIADVFGVTRQAIQSYLRLHP